MVLSAGTVSGAVVVVHIVLVPQLAGQQFVWAQIKESSYQFVLCHIWANYYRPVLCIFYSVS